MKLDAMKMSAIINANAAWTTKDQNVREGSESPANLWLTTAIGMILLMPSGPSPSVWRRLGLIHGECFCNTKQILLPLTGAFAGVKPRVTRGRESTNVDSS